MIKTKHLIQCFGEIREDMKVKIKGPFQVVLVVKNLPANEGDTRDMGSIFGSGRSRGVGNGNVLQYSCP